MTGTYTFTRSADGRRYTVTTTDGEQRRTLPSVVADRSAIYPMLDALVATLLDWLGDDREFQAALLAKAMVGVVNKLVARHKNRSWDRFTLNDAEIESIVSQLLIDSYALCVDARDVFTIEYCGGQRRDLLRGEVIRETTR